MPSSPLRKGTLPAVGGAPPAVEAVEAVRAGAEADGGLMSLDEYDPKEAAARDLARARDEVTRLRTETSDLHHAVEIAERQLEKVQTEAESLLREDDVEEQRRVAEAELGELKRNVELLTAKLEAAEQYELTLRHMLSRLQFDKLSHMAMMKAFEEALRVHRHEAKLHERHLQQAQRAAADEEEELRSLVVKQQRQKQSLEEKLEARRAEVLARQRRKAEREKWLREEMNLKARAEGDLTEEEEKQLKKKAASLRAEAITLAKRLRYAIVRRTRASVVVHTHRNLADHLLRPLSCPTRHARRASRTSSRATTTACAWRRASRRQRCCSRTTAHPRSARRHPTGSWSATRASTTRWSTWTRICTT